MIHVLPFVTYSVQTTAQLTPHTAENICSPAELARYHSLPDIKQTAWLLGRLAAKEAIQHFHKSSLSRSAIEIFNHATGAPDYRLDTTLEPGRLSLSHTTSIGVAAITDNSRKIGIDVEHVRNWDPKTITSFTTEAERQNLEAVSPTKRNLQATILWSAKEAYLKLLGTGLTRHPRTVEITVSKNTFLVADQYSQQTTKTFWTQYTENCIIAISTT